MGVKGQSQEVKNNLVCGVAEVKVIAFNPTLEEYEKIYGPKENEGSEEVKEPEYLKQKDGEEMLLATFIVEVVGGKFDGKKQKIVFPIIKKEDLKDSGNTLFVNDKGETSYIDLEENLKEFFTHVKKWDNSARQMYNFRECKIRKGFVGEKAFLEFITMWLNLDFSLDADTEIWLDMNKLFSGDFREIKQVVNSFSPQTVLTAWHVKTVEGEDGIKQYQNIFRGAFSNTRTRKSNLIAVFNNLSEKGVDWKVWCQNNEKDWNLRNFRRFIDQVTGEYGPDGFVLQPLGEYDPNSDLATSRETKVSDPGYSTNDSY
jgi:hypothetical protein